MTHCRFASENDRPRWIEGSAMFTIVASRMTMNWARQTMARTSQRLDSVRAAFGMRSSCKRIERSAYGSNKWSDQSACVTRVTMLRAAMTSTLALAAMFLVIASALVLIRLHTLGTGVDP